jgi:hypothetical protein
MLAPTDDPIADLVLALSDEEAARASVRDARARQADALIALRAAGLSIRAVAHRVARARGLTLPIGERLRFAERLRKRASREQKQRTSVRDPQRQSGLECPRTG